MSAVKVLKSLLLGIPLALLVQHFYWKKLLAFTYGDASLIQCIFYCIVLALVFCVVEVYVAKYDHPNERIPISVVWVLLSVVKYISTLRQLSNNGAGLAEEKNLDTVVECLLTRRHLLQLLYDRVGFAEGKNFNALLFYGAAYLIGIYIVIQVSYLIIGEVKGLKREQSRQREYQKSEQGTSAVKVLKALLLGGPLVISIQYFYWKKVLYEYTNMLSTEFFIFCTMLILVFCVLEEYLIFYKDYNWKEKLPLDIIWVVCSTIYYLNVSSKIAEDT
ncbi:MAG: hypothetical protein NC489_37440, partial [Ruminococcus flavefaciens]|nr:hypothetical protein [Ruminococcus flavefaciens]